MNNLVFLINKCSDVVANIWFPFFLSTVFTNKNRLLLLFFSLTKFFLVDWAIWSACHQIAFIIMMRGKKRWMFDGHRSGKKGIFYIYFFCQLLQSEIEEKNQCWWEVTSSLLFRFVVIGTSNIHFKYDRWCQCWLENTQWALVVKIEKREQS